MAPMLGVLLMPPTFPKLVALGLPPRGGAVIPKGARWGVPTLLRRADWRPGVVGRGGIARGGALGGTPILPIELVRLRIIVVVC
jgi:hypothetical protein